MLKVQEFLLNHSLSDLEKQKGVYSRFSEKNPLKFSLNYDQIEAKSGDEITEECRGLVLELKDKKNVSKDETVGNTNLLCFGFKRFYNDGDPCAASIDWNNAVFFEKLDGTLCQVYWDPTLKRFCVATRSVPDADVPFENVTGKTFRQLFEQAAVATYLNQRPNDTNPQRFFDMWLHSKFTYMFELCTPENEVLVSHREHKIWLLGARNNETLLEEDVTTKKYTDHFDVCPSYLLSFETMHKFVLDRSDPRKYEGLVIRDKFFNRIKIKDLAYVIASKLKDRAVKSPRALLELILIGKDDDVRPLLAPELQAGLDKRKANLAHWIGTEDMQYRMLKIMIHGAENPRKELALLAKQKNGTISVLMFQYDNKGTAKDWIYSHQNKDGTFPNSFLDKLDQMIGM
jgi:hypothetical protein